MAHKFGPPLGFECLHRRCPRASDREVAVTNSSEEAKGESMPRYASTCGRAHCIDAITLRRRREKAIRTTRGRSGSILAAVRESRHQSFLHIGDPAQGGTIGKSCMRKH